ncbi:putative DUF4194 domain-containing protein [uncultured Thiomicrorhabdus sp.]
MFREVNTLIESEGLEFNDITDASSHLLKYQFAFRTGNATDRKVFDLVASHSTMFEKIFSLFGFQLVVNNEYSYVGYLPDKKRYFQIPREQTNILLVLRIIYHRERISGNSENGVVLITGSQLTEVYKDQTGDELDANYSSFESMLKPLSDKRIIKLDREREIETNLPNIFIMPSIQDIANKEFAEGVLDQIAELRKEIGDSDEA